MVQSFPIQMRRMNPSIEDKIYRPAGKSLTIPSGRLEAAFTIGPGYQLPRTRVIKKSPIPKIQCHDYTYHINPIVTLGREIDPPTLSSDSVHVWHHPPALIVFCPVPKFRYASPRDSRTQSLSLIKTQKYTNAKSVMDQTFQDKRPMSN